MTVTASPRGLPLEIRGLTKRFGHVVAVNDLSFTVQPGRVTGFLGPNGSGKTTTLRMLLGLVAPTAGHATIAGHDYRELDDPVTKVGAVLEATSFHPARRARSHLRMVALAGGLPLHRVDEVLDLVGLTQDAKRRVGGFSLGMRQRLELAAALLGDPDVLILDEPANGLDPQGIAWLREFMRHLAGEGRTVLVSSHLLSEMSQTVDEVVIISQGQLRAQGTLAELTSQLRPSMRVRTPEADRLLTLLSAVALSGRRLSHDVVVIDDATPERLGPVLAEHQVVVYELAPEGNSLETMFLELTAGLGFGQVPPAAGGGYYPPQAGYAQGWAPAPGSSPQPWATTPEGYAPPPGYAPPGWGPAPAGYPVAPGWAPPVGAPPVGAPPIGAPPVGAPPAWAPPVGEPPAWAPPVGTVPGAPAGTSPAAPPGPPPSPGPGPTPPGAP